MIWRILGLLIVSSMAAAANAAVSAQLSEQVIDELETVRLTIRASQTRQTESLDLSALEQDFHVMGTNTSSQYRFINGREQSWVDYQITLQPKRTGEITIPRIAVGPDRTPTIVLTVRPLTDETRQLIDELVFFEQEFSAEEIYVQSELVVTRRLLYSNGVQLYSDLPGTPEIPDAVVMNIGEPVSSTTKRGDKNYGVVEQKFAIFPEVSGRFEIPAINVTASVRLIDAGRVSRKGVRVGTDSVTIQVLPVPAEYPADKPWLPAHAVVLERSLEPTNVEHNVGDTLNHQLKVVVSGNMGSTVPPVDLEIDDAEFRSYPQAPELTDDTSRGIVTGTRLQRSSLLPVRPGALVLPEAKLTWWDTRRDILREAHLPAQALTVSGDAMVAAVPAGQTEESDASGADPSPPVEPQIRTYLSDAWVWIVATLAVAALALLIFYRRPEQEGREEREEHVSDEPPFIDIPTLAGLKKDLKTSEPSHIYHLLCRALAGHFKTSEIHALQLFRKSSVAADSGLNTLTDLVYGDHQQEADTSEMRAQLLEAIEFLSKKPKHVRQQTLPPLYSHSPT